MYNFCFVRHCINVGNYRSSGCSKRNCMSYRKPWKVDLLLLRLGFEIKYLYTYTSCKKEKKKEIFMCILMT